jgi:predicted dinucleotide-binding enzyme
MAKYGVLGSGAVAQALSRGLVAEGHEVRLGSRSPGKLAAFASEIGAGTGSFGQVAQWAEVVVLAVAGSGAEDALTLAGTAALAGKVVIDTTNPIAGEGPVDGVLQYFTGPNESLLERLQAQVPGARFVKAFSCVGSAYMVKPNLPGGPPTMFICGNDDAAKGEVTALLRQFGWDVEDMGTAVAARAIEPLAQLWCLPGFRENRWSHAFRLLRA